MSSFNWSGETVETRNQIQSKKMKNAFAPAFASLIALCANESYRRSSDSKIETVSWASFRTFDQKKGIKRRSLSTSLFPSSSSFLLCSTLYKMQLSTTLLAPVLLALSISRSSASPIEKRDGPLKLGQVSFGLLP